MSILTTLRRRKRRFYKALFLGFAVSLLLTLGSSLGYLDFIEAKALDFLMLVRGQQRSPEIVLVTIDDQAFEQLGEKQPLSRSYIANLIEVVARGGARVIGLDIEFKVPTDPKEDQRLLQAIERAEHGGTSKVVLTYVVRPEKEDAAGLLYRRPPFFAALNTVAGFANAAVDVDGFVRQVPVALRASDGAIIPSLGLAALARAAGYDAKTLESSLKQDVISLRLPEIDRLTHLPVIDPTPFKVEPGESWRINFAGGRGSFVSLPSGPLAQLAAAGVPLAADNPFRDKIVLIGATFQESRDFFPTPYGLMSGLEIHANIIHTLLTRSQVQTAHRVLAFSILLGFTFITSLLITLFSPTLVAILSLVAVPVLLIPLSYLAFAYLGLWIDFVIPLFATCWGALAVEYMESRHVRKSLNQHVGWEVAKQIVDQDEQLTGRRREVTVFLPTCATSPLSVRAWRPRPWRFA